MLRSPIVSPWETTSSSLPNRNMVTLLRRSRPLRCLMIACLSVVAGWLMLMLMLPYLPSENTAAILAAHLPASDTSPLRFWMTLCVARFPFWLLIAISGFTRFSGGLTSAVTVYRGLCDGAVMGILAKEMAGRMSVLPVSYTGHRFIIAFSIWATTDLLIRLFMTLEARRVADMAWSSHEDDGRMSPSDKAGLWRYILCCLGGLIATLATCGLYTAFLYF